MKACGVAQPAYGLASMLPPTMLSDGWALPMPEILSARFPAAALFFLAGFVPDPFKPPRY
jgi:hypothetical protein